MHDHCQYGEEQIVLPFFDGLRDGLVVDVGAADGVEFSNSRFLIRDWGWRGILIEPEPAQFSALSRLYEGSQGVQTIEAAVGEPEGIVELWPWALGSTISLSWRDRFPRESFGESVKVRMQPLGSLLDATNCPRMIDFLSVDCEGMDFDVLRSMDWGRKVRLLCVESGGFGESEMHNYLCSVGFAYHDRTAGNTFWRSKDAA